ncbi:hypothetical protein GCM10010387_26910 [Streptomyces inusitatus]|uniref:VWFA domain-containing protein n=1 Tax=Streptomyces inusitatus TaxID=68221 RepID=A0A918USQ0_9ACTN|nr:VWA domain-containing protein [Streptomyces inusitatus]GGZ31541.1 hypothetical protein GCM10010387_26910 [Streptomyces inusitatus]
MRVFQPFRRSPQSRTERPPGPRGVPGTALRRPAVALLLLVSAVVAPGSGSAAAGTGAGASAAGVPSDPVTPAVVEEAVDPGGSIGVDKEVRTPAIPPKPDVVLLVDGTNSMEDSIDDIKGQLSAITGKVRETQQDSRFAVATFGDQELDPANGQFEVLQGLTHDLTAVREGVNQLDHLRGIGSRGPSEDWINGLWQIANGAGGETVFREGASPVVVLVGDASSHNPSAGHTIGDTISDLQAKNVRVIGVDVETRIGDGLNGNGDAGNDDGQIEDPPTTPGQATRIITATGGRLLTNIKEDEVAEAIVEGFDNLPTSVGHQLADCDPDLTVSLEPPTRKVTSGAVAAFEETVDVATDAPQGATLTCTVQFLLGAQAPGDEEIGPAAVADPGYQQKISVKVNDVSGPEVVVDDRTVRAEDEEGARVRYRATARDDIDGTLVPRCVPPSGSLFPIGTTTVVCTAVDSRGNVGRDTAVVEVLEMPEVPKDPPGEKPPGPQKPPKPPKPSEPLADVAVSVDVSPDRTYTTRPARTRFTLTNAGPDTATNVVLRSVWPEPARAKDRTLRALNRCTAAAPCSIPAGERLQITQTGTYRTAVNSEVRATVRGARTDRRPVNNKDSDRLRVLKPSLTVTPEVAKPGQPVLARGKDYPPGTAVHLTWNVGITASTAAVTAARDGTFEAQVLVLRKDRLGPRELRASARNLARLKRPVLVVQRNLQPPDFAGRS